jgi:O-antigen/teichoic acid export membrane protein
LIEPAIAQEEEHSSQPLAPRAAWILFAKSVAFVLSFALPLLLVRRLSQHEFGLYKQVFLVVNTAFSIVPLNFGMSVYYFLPRERERQNQIVLNVVLFYLLAAGLACAALFIRPELLTSLFNSPEAGDFAPLIGVAIFFWILPSFLEIVAVANQEAKLATVFIIASQFTKGSLLIIAAAIFSTVQSLIYAAIVQGVLQSLILFLYLRSRFPHFWRGFDWTVMRQQLSYAIPLGIAGVMYTVQLDLHNYFVANHFDAATFAIYAIGCFQLPFVGILNESLASVMIPRVSFLQKHGRRREIIELTARVMRKLAAVYFPLYVFLLLIGREFITLLFTDRYLASLPIFLINLTLLPVSILLLDPIMRAYAEQRYFLLKLHIALIVLLVLSLWFATRYLGMIGIITVVVGVSLIERLAKTIRMGRIVGVSRHDIVYLKDVGKIGVAALVAGGVAMMTKSLLMATRPLLLIVETAVIFFAVYLAILLLSHILTQEERQLVRSQIARFKRIFSKQPILLESKGEVVTGD